MKKASPPFSNSRVEEVFNNYPAAVRSRLLTIRKLIFDTAAKTPGVGKLEETLKWAQPSYLTSETGSGTTLRIDHIPKQPGNIAVLVHCQSNIVTPFKKMYGNLFDYDGSRAIMLDHRDALPEKEICHFIYLALTYHLRKKGKF